MMKRRSLLTRMVICIDTGDILGKNSSIGTGDMGIFWFELIT